MWGVSTQEKAPTSAKPLNPLDTFFHITERGSTIGREIRGGVVTFFAMAYILVVNPSILSAALPQDGSITPAGIAAGTALVAGIMTILMGVVANYPLALAAGLGLNAIVAFTLVLGSGLSFQEAMGLIFWYPHYPSRSNRVPRRGLPRSPVPDQDRYLCRYRSFYYPGWPDQRGHYSCRRNPGSARY